MLRRWSRFSIFFLTANGILFGTLSCAFLLRPAFKEIEKIEVKSTPELVLPSIQVRPIQEVVENAIAILLEDTSSNTDFIREVADKTQSENSVKLPGQTGSLPVYLQESNAVGKEVSSKELVRQLDLLDRSVERSAKVSPPKTKAIQKKRVVHSFKKIS